MKKFIKGFFTILFPLWTFIGSKTSYLWMIASIFGLYIFNSPDTGDNINWALTDGFPTSKLFTIILMPLNIYLFQISDYLEHGLYIDFPKYYKILSIVGFYFSLQIVFLRCFLIMLMRFSAPMAVVLVLSIKRVFSMTRRAELNERSSWLPPVDKTMDRKLHPYKKLLRKEVIPYGRPDAEYFEEKAKKELEKQKFVKKYPVYTETSAVMAEDSSKPATAPNYYDWYKKVVPNETIRNAVSVKKKRNNPYKDSNHVGMFQN